MPIKDFGKGIKDSLKGTVDTVKDKVKSIDAEKIKGNIHSAAETVKDKAVQTGSMATEQVKKLFNKQPQEKERPMYDFSRISTKSALKLIYFLIAADGEIFQSEEEKFDAIGNELEQDFGQIKESLIGECKAVLAPTDDMKEYVESLKKGVSEVLFNSVISDGDTLIPPDLLVWDLLAVAYSDGSFGEEEQELVNYIVEQFGIDNGIFHEMHSSAETLMDLEKELTWIKSTNKPYLTIEAHVNQINERKKSLMDSVKTLISLQEV